MYVNKGGLPCITHLYTSGWQALNADLSSWEGSIEYIMCNTPPGSCRSLIPVNRFSIYENCDDEHNLNKLDRCIPQIMIMQRNMFFTLTHCGSVIPHCEFWIRDVDLVNYKPISTTEQPSHTHPLPLQEYKLFSQKYTHQEWLTPTAQMVDAWARWYKSDAWARWYKSDLQILHTAFQTTSLKVYTAISHLHLGDLLKNLLRLLARKTELERNHHSEIIKDSFSQALLIHILTALQKWALVSQSYPGRYT